MNRWMRKRIAVLVAVLALATLITGCKKKVKEPIEPVTEPVAATEMTTVPAETLPEETELVTEPVIVAPEAGSITYEAYLNLSAEEQQAYYGNFDSSDAFHEWLDAAMKEYGAETEPVETFAPAEPENDTVETVPEATAPEETKSGLFFEESVMDMEEALEDLE